MGAANTHLARKHGAEQSVASGAGTVGEKGTVPGTMFCCGGWFMLHKIDAFENHDGVTVVELSGELDVYAAADVRRRLSGIRQAVVLDFTAVTYMDASILTELIVLAKRLAPERAKLAGLRPHLRRLFGITKLEDVFHFSADALASPMQRAR